MLLSQQYEESVQKFSFLGQHHFKELYYYIYIVTFGKHRSDLCGNLFLDPQCIVSQEEFQYKTLNWSTLFPLLPLHTSRAGKRG